MIDPSFQAYGLPKSAEVARLTAGADELGKGWIYLLANPQRLGERCVMQTLDRRGGDNMNDSGGMKDKVIN